jgi:hypothetical protein
MDCIHEAEDFKTSINDHQPSKPIQRWGLNQDWGTQQIVN